MRSRRGGRKIHSSAAGSSNKPFAVTRYAPIAPRLPTDDSHPEGCSLGASAWQECVEEQQERGAL